MENLKDKMFDLTTEILLGTEFKIVDIGFTKTSRSGVFRVFIDSERGITVDECHRIGRDLRARIEDKSTFPYDVVLEVSSPGVERPFTEEWQFRKNLGRTVILTLKTDEGPDQTISGILERISDGQVMISVAGKKKKTREECCIPMDRIKHGQVQLQW